MNVFYIIAIALGWIFAFIMFMPFSSNMYDKWNKKTAKGYGIILAVLTLLIVFFTRVGDGKLCSDKLKEQKILYENYIIDGKYEIGYNKTFTIVNGDTTEFITEPFIILKE